MDRQKEGKSISVFHCHVCVRKTRVEIQGHIALSLSLSKKTCPRVVLL